MYFLYILTGLVAGCIEFCLTALVVKILFMSNSPEKESDNSTGERTEDAGLCKKSLLSVLVTLVVKSVIYIGYVVIILTVLRDGLIPEAIGFFSGMILTSVINFVLSLTVHKSKSKHGNTYGKK